MKIVFSAQAGYGHLYPLLPLASACVDAGHEVTIATGDPFVGRLPFPSIRCLPAGMGLSDMEQEVLRRRPDADPMSFAMALFGEVTPEYVTPALLDAFDRDRPDLVVYEATNAGAAVAAEARGIPAVAFGIGQYLPMIDVLHDNAARFQRNLWPGEPPNLLTAYIDPMPRALETPLPPGRIPIRSVPWSESDEVPQWLTQESGRRRVYMTLGTVAFRAVDVLRRAIEETAQHDVDVLVAVGPEGDTALLGDLPSTVHAERFVSQPAVLPHVDLVVHHGGSGTMLGALSHGLPQLILPQGADQFINADKIGRIQAGRALHNDAQVPGAIAEAVGALLADGPERVTAKRVATEIAGMPAPRDVVEELTSRLS
jgi:UDP:flavonoid glycosyltransferase YjiC (YdhE family)